MTTISKKLMAVMAIAILGMTGLTACSSDGNGGNTGSSGNKTSAPSPQGKETKEAKIDPSVYENLPADVKANLDEAWAHYQKDTDNREIKIAVDQFSSNDPVGPDARWWGTTCYNYTSAYPDPPLGGGEIVADEGVVCDSRDGLIVYRYTPCEDQICFISIAAEHHWKYRPESPNEFDLSITTFLVDDWDDYNNDYYRESKGGIIN